jgi:hypothetical protein
VGLNSTGGMDAGVRVDPPSKESYRLCIGFPLALQPQFGPCPTSTKFSVSLRFTTFARAPWAGDELVARPLYLYTNTEKRTHTQTLNIHTLSGIRTHDPGFRAKERQCMP